MKPQVVTYHLNRLLDDDAIIVSDTGTVTTWAARYLQVRGAMMFSTSGMLATMGNGLPYAVAAAVAYPGRQVVALCGDGGFTSSAVFIESFTTTVTLLPTASITDPPWIASRVFAPPAARRRETPASR